MSSYCDRDYLQALLDVEIALAAAQAETGLIPADSLPHIRAAARVDAYDREALDADALRDGNVVIPLVRQMTAAVAAHDAGAARYVHRGATSQDIADTAMVLRLRATHATLRGSLTQVMESAAGLTREFATTPMPGRTWLQHASPTTFGLKAAGWLDLVGRCRDRLDRVVESAMVLQLGGASGTLAAMGADGPAIAEAMAKHLALRVPPMPWHTQRDRIVDVASALGIACGGLGKIGRDLALLAQSEVAEASDAGGGGSSSMPHKQNPVRAVTAIAAAVRAPGMVATMLSAMPQEHERAAGGWQAEWPTLADLIAVTQQSADAIAGALGDLRVDASEMREHLAIRGGVAMAEALSAALASHVSRKDAMALVEKLVRTAEHDRRSLREVATAHPEVTRWLAPADVERALDPENFLGSAQLFIERVLREWEI